MTNQYFRVFPHVSTESLPNFVEPLLPFIHFEGKVTNPSDLMWAIMSFMSDAIDILGQFSLSVYKFELLDGVKIVELVRQFSYKDGQIDTNLTNFVTHWTFLHTLQNAQISNRGRLLLGPV